MNAKKRMANIELLRAISMLMVITIHFLGRGQVYVSAAPLSAPWVLASIWDGLATVSVNVYVLISGYFLIHSKFKWQKLIDIVLQVFTYSFVLYVVSVLLGWNSFSLVAFGKACFPLLTSQYWFASVYVGLYCVFPFINKCLLNLSKNQHRNLCLLLVVLCSLHFPAKALVVNGYSLMWMITLYVIAAYIRLYYTPPKTLNLKLLLLYLVPTALLPLSKICISLAAKLVSSSLMVYSGWFYKNNSLLELFSALGLFLVFLSVDIKNEKACKLARVAGGVSFGVYLFHNNPSIRERFWEWIDLPRFADKWWFFFFGVLVIVLIFIVSGVVEWIRKLLYQKFVASKFYECCIKKISSLRVFKYFVNVE